MIKDTIKNEQGFVLITSLLMLTILMIIGIAATNTTIFELQIAGNDRSHKEAFYSADSGIGVAAKVISQAVDEQAVPSLGGFTLDTNLYSELAGFSAHDSTADIEFSLGSTNLVKVDVERGNQFLVAGGGAEFAAGSEGIGPSSSGVFFNIDSFGYAPNLSISNVGAQYLKMINIAGGL